MGYNIWNWKKGRDSTCALKTLPTTNNDTDSVVFNKYVLTVFFSVCFIIYNCQRDEFGEELELF